MVDYVKYLMWLPIFAVPFMVFWARPQSRVVWRIGRLLAAVAMLYVVFGLIMYHQFTLRMSAAEVVNEQTVECQHPPCESRAKPKFSRRVVTHMLHDIWFLWWPLLFYVGFWELAWRLWHRKEVRALPRRDIGAMFSTSMIFISALGPISFYLYLAYQIGFYKGILSFGLNFFMFLFVFSPLWVVGIFADIAEIFLKIINN